ncbi:MAG: hypothetical protein CMH76_10250 [Nitrospinae bacterium]|nr:hypothetical protein [Nitrospinota bacterium]
MIGKAGGEGAINQGAAVAGLDNPGTLPEFPSARFLGERMSVFTIIALGDSPLDGKVGREGGGRDDLQVRVFD